MARSKVSRELLAALAASIAFHGLWLVRDAKASAKREATVSEVALETDMPRPKPVEPVVPPAAPTNAAPEPVLRHQAARAQTTSAAQQQPAAQAAKTLTAADDGNTADLADFTLVQGESTNYAGGTTSAIGTSRAAVRGPASDVAAPIVRSKNIATADEGAPDLSRSATPVNPAWDCSRLFPEDVDAGDYATVLIAVSVGTDGRPKRVAMLRDPGHGFGPAAVQCAMLQRYNVALNRVGTATAATTPPIVVRFSR